MPDVGYDCQLARREDAAHLFGNRSELVVALADDQVHRDFYLPEPGPVVRHPAESRANQAIGQTSGVMLPPLRALSGEGAGFHLHLTREQWEALPDLEEGFEAFIQKLPGAL